MTRSPELSVQIERAASGDAEAFQRVIQARHRRIRAIALAITGSVEGSDDVCQDVLLKVWEALPTLKDPAALDAWLAQITRRVATDWLRTRARHQRNAHRQTDLNRLAAAAETPLDTLCSSERRELLEAGLRQLDEHERLLFTLYYRQEESTAAVADALGIAPATARKRLQRIRERLQAGVASLLASLLITTRVEASPWNGPPTARRWPLWVSAALLVVALVIGVRPFWESTPDLFAGVDVAADVHPALESAAAGDAVNVMVGLTGPGFLHTLNLLLTPGVDDFGLPDEATTGPLAELYELERAVEADLAERIENHDDDAAAARERIYDQLEAGETPSFGGVLHPEFALKEDGSPSALRALELLEDATDEDRPQLQRFVIQQAYLERFPQRTDANVVLELLPTLHDSLLELAGTVATKLSMKNVWLSSAQQEQLLSLAPEVQLQTRATLLTILHNHAMEAQDEDRVHKARAMLHSTIEEACAWSRCPFLRKHEATLATQVVNPDAPASTWQQGLRQVAQRCHLEGEAIAPDHKSVTGMGLATHKGWAWIRWEPRHPWVSMGDEVPSVHQWSEELASCIGAQPYEGPPPPVGTRVWLHVEGPPTLDLSDLRKASHQPW